MDDLTSKLNEIFSSPEGMEKIKTLVGMLSSSGGGEGAKPEEPPPDDGDGFNIDPSMLLTIKRAFDAMKGGDPRIDLLLALKPNLSEDRRKKVDEAIQIMRLINIMPLLREQGFLRGDE